MADVRTIAQHIRVLLTAVTLLCVLLLNHQEITTYRPTPVPPAADSQLQTTDKEPAVVKQKISFEATAADLVLLVAPLAVWRHPVVYTPQLATTATTLFPPAGAVISFRQILFSCTIIPNAP